MFSSRFLTSAYIRSFEMRRNENNQRHQSRRNREGPDTGSHDAISADPWIFLQFTKYFVSLIEV